jgi:hypothetical protein
MSIGRHFSPFFPIAKDLQEGSQEFTFPAGCDRDFFQKDTLHHKAPFVLPLNE